MSPFKIFFFMALLTTVFSFSAANFISDVDVYLGPEHVKISNNGELLTLSLVDKSSGSGFRSKNEYLFGKIDTEIKLVPGNSAGIVTTFSLRSEGSTRDEILFQFLGNSTGDPYTLTTNIFSSWSISGSTQQWLSTPTPSFGTLKESFDDIPIREFKNSESVGVSFPNRRPRYMSSSIWAAEDWTTQGGPVKIDWSKAPFRASFRNLKIDGCVYMDGGSSCSTTKPISSWYTHQLDVLSQARLKWVQKNYMIYNYCKDIKKFPQGIPPECATS